VSARFRDHTSVSAAEYDSDRQGHLEDRRFALIDEAIRSRPSLARVLEIGSGAGSLLARVAAAHPGVHCTGIELEPELAEHARSRHGGERIEFVEADVTAFAPPDAYDLCFSVDVIHHFHDRPGAFTAIRAALRFGAPWIAMEPNILHPYIALKQERMKHAGLDEDHFRPWESFPELRRAGFAVDRRCYLLLYPGGFEPTLRLAAIERVLERVPVLGGSVAVYLSAA
jgi:SAM-dependent methyltransferase